MVSTGNILAHSMSAGENRRIACACQGIHKLLGYQIPAAEYHQQGTWEAVQTVEAFGYKVGAPYFNSTAGRPPLAQIFPDCRTQAYPTDKEFAPERRIKKPLNIIVSYPRAG